MARAVLPDVPRDGPPQPRIEGSAVSARGLGMNPTRHCSDELKSSRLPSPDWSASEAAGRSVLQTQLAKRPRAPGSQWNIAAASMHECCYNFREEHDLLGKQRSRATRRELVKGELGAGKEVKVNLGP